jgi:ABC-type cobalamin/Fe3+-siderophores transport system ATPase subunit
VLIADEPVSMVDASLRVTILNNVALLRREHGVSIINITMTLRRPVTSPTGSMSCAEGGPWNPVVSRP